MASSNAIKISIAAGASSSNWFRLPTVMESATPISFTGVLTSGDTVYVEVSNDDALDASLVSTDRNQSTGTTTQKATSTAYTTTSFTGLVLGSWRWVRITKTGTTGAATVQVR